MNKYRKKPAVVEAMRFNGNNVGNVLAFMMQENKKDAVISDNGVVIGLRIQTLEGEMVASVDDYIIKGIKGEFYPCKPDIFEASYDLVPA